MKIFTAAIAIISICITAIALLSTIVSGSHLLELLSAFQNQYFIANLILGLITLGLVAKRTKQSRRLLCLNLFCIALISAQILPWHFPSIEPLADGKIDTHYRVMSTNLNVANSDATKVLALTEKEQPDLAIFIEVNDEMAKQLDTLKQVFPYSTNQLTPYQPGAVIYSQYPLTNFNIQKFNTNNAVNLTVQAQIENKTLSIIAIHPLPPIRKSFFQSRNTVFEAVGTYIQQQQESVLLIGDFNATIWSPAYRKLARQTGLDNSRKGFGVLPTWPTNTAEYFGPVFAVLEKLIAIPIDQCLVSPDLIVTDMRVGPEVGSDHLPIVVDFLAS